MNGGGPASPASDPRARADRLESLAVSRCKSNLGVRPDRSLKGGNLTLRARDGDGSFAPNIAVQPIVAATPKQTFRRRARSTAAGGGGAIATFTFGSTAGAAVPVA